MLSRMPPISTVSERPSASTSSPAGAPKLLTVHPLCRLIVVLCAPGRGAPLVKTTFEEPVR